ncbi:flippase [Flavobacterium sp. 120]|uniref:flippase n=1 Tax=Flavobacterium sp. 120 TaxID=2135626 RepID=UPI000EAD73E9|nr:flippase [Flavobacterium sp. 120]RKS13320.1 O-antigen/teichoic acid export membrane protein [Flavobacterium sp. 120]
MTILRKNIFYNTLLSLSQILFPLVTFPYVSRVLGPNGVGQVSFVDSFTQYFILFSALGIPLYGVRELSKIRNKVQESSKLFTELILLHLISTFLLLIVYLALIYLLSYKGININLFFIGCGILLSNVFIVEWYYQSQEKFGFITKRTIILRFMFIILLFFIVNDKADFVKYYLLFLLLNVLNAGVNFYFVLKSEIKLDFLNLNLNKHIKPLFLLVSCSVIGSVYVLLDNVILGILSTTESVGFYSSAIKITKIPISLISSLGIVLIPRLSESFSNNDLKSIKYYIDSSVQFVLTFGVPLCLGIALTAKWTVLIISGTEFEPSIELVRYLSPIIILIALNGIFFFQLFTPGNKEVSMIIILAMSAIISIVLNLILIPKIQHLGAAITTTITEFSVFLISIYFAKKHFNIKINFKMFINPLLSSLVFIPIIFLVELFSVNIGLKLILSAVLCILSYYIIQKFVFNDAIISRMEDFVKDTLKIK